ncbi:unnamed protein product [Durusdinium trenchii]|uniref:Nudix hydrolase domain-containing protein n=1 Tax=Durusdinium trenchii TaxID=1381693 RepID=A0ABP0RT29_9DINO
MVFCRYGYDCLRADCWFEHPEVLIMRNDTGSFRVLLQLRSWDMPVMPGHLGAVGGMRDARDLDSSVTAVREVFEETGLLDVGHLPSAPWRLRAEARKGSVIPQCFFKFGEGAHVDWWVLLLSGPGTFVAAKDSAECADISRMLPHLPSAKLAPCFGHAWMEAARVPELPKSVELMGGLQRRVGEHRKFGRSYKIALNKSGKLLWQGSHITGEPLLGVLTPEGMWICSELLTPKEEKIGSVRLRHGPEWDQLSLNFKTNSVTQWGADVCATRVTAEIRICRPPFPSMESKPSFAEAQPGLVPIKAVSSIAAAAELSTLSLLQLKECLKEYGVTEYGRFFNQKESLVELLAKVEATVPLVGRWQYGKAPNRKSYQIRRLISGVLKWEGPHSRGGMLSGILEEDEGWLVAQLMTNQNETIGSIRLRHGPKWNEVMSNFRSHMMTEWGSDIIAERVGEEEPLRRPSFDEETEEEEDVVLTDISELSAQEVKLCLKEYGVTKIHDLERREQLVELLEKVEDSLPLVGTWQHGRHNKQYEIQHTEDGQLLWEGPHIFGGTLVGVLYDDADWLRAELFTCKEESEQVGSVKVTHGPDWHEMTLKFMQSNSGLWGDNIIAKRVTKEHAPRRPKPLPAVRDFEDDDELVESQYWESLEVLSQALRVEHAALVPLERRAKSWARSVAFAQMTLGMRGIPMKGADGVRWRVEDATFVIWVLGATAEVEVSLAEQGYFKDVNWLDRAPTKVYIIGENLLEDLVEEESKTKETVAASVTKEDAATYVVVYSRASAELCARIRQRSVGPTWALIDGRQLGLGKLLEKKAASADIESPKAEGLEISRMISYGHRDEIR